MNKYLKLALIAPIIILLSAMTVAKVKLLQFKHPKKSEYLIQIETENLGKFSKEWRGQDYYYNNLGKSDINCSLLFYKLNEHEVKQLDLYPKELTQGTESGPAFPMTYFLQNSKTKEKEINKKRWGTVKDDFMYYHADYPIDKNATVKLKSMYAYCMFDRNMFVQIHLSKMMCDEADSIEMRTIIDSFKKVKAI